MRPTYRLRILHGELKSAVPSFYRRHLLIDGAEYTLVEGVKHLDHGGTLIATPRKACYGRPIRLHVGEDGRIERRAA